MTCEFSRQNGRTELIKPKIQPITSTLYSVDSRVIPWDIANNAATIDGSASTLVVVTVT